MCSFQQGLRFDPDLPQTLRLEFAKTNTKVAKPKQQVQQLAIAGQLAAAATGQNAVATAFIQPMASRTSRNTSLWHTMFVECRWTCNVASFKYFILTTCSTLLHTYLLAYLE